MPETAQTRVDRRKARTRMALVTAAQRLFAAQGHTGASIQEITDAADVGFGTFYNHFASKTELFDIAIADMFDQHGAWLDGLLGDEDDPAVVFASSLRLTGRLLHTRPEMAQVMMHATGDLLRAGTGLAPRALRDIRRAVDAGRFQVGDEQVALACAAGSLVGVLQMLENAPAEDVERATDEMTHNVLRMFGLADEESTRLVELPLTND